MPRWPITSEQDAFRLTLAGTATMAASVLLGWFVHPLAGVGLLVVVALAALTAYVRFAGREPDPGLRRAAHGPHPHGGPPGTRHVLVVANETVDDGALPERLLSGEDGRVEVDVLAPVLTPPTHYVVSDIDYELEEARSRLERSLEWMHAHGVRARGAVGDPNPITAIEDELRDFGADEIIVVTHPRERESWQERGELERLRRELDVPITHVVLGAERTPRERSREGEP